MHYFFILTIWRPLLDFCAMFCFFLKWSSSIILFFSGDSLTASGTMRVCSSVTGIVEFLSLKGFFLYQLVFGGNSCLSESSSSSSQMDRIFAFYFYLSVIFICYVCCIMPFSFLVVTSSRRLEISLRIFFLLTVTLKYLAFWFYLD